MGINVKLVNGIPMVSVELEPCDKHKHCTACGDCLVGKDRERTVCYAAKCDPDWDPTDDDLRAMGML
jgi:pyrimidine deaminase RibD-like protein